jgi:chondroitin AC lyase
MFSTRNRNMEEPYNGPGKTTHHRADGTNYLMLQGDEYHNIWPVYDWQKISGTTIMQKPQLHGPEDIQKDGLRDFVGAVTDGMFGAVAFDFKSPHDGLEAKKSWFFFEDDYVCLGTDIKSRPNLPVSTTINQSLLRSEVNLSQAGKRQVVSAGRRELEGVKWVHQDRIGYIFPEETKINLSNQTEEGRWSDITDQKNISQELVQEDVFMLWFDHGNRPQKASYEYIVVPDVGVEDLQASAGNNRGIRILSNNGQVQAVFNEKLNLFQAAFHEAGEVQVKDGLKLNLESQGMAMLQLNGNRIEKLTVADPSRKLKKLMLTVSGIYEGKGEGYQLFPDKSAGNTMIVVELPEGVYMGKSVEVNF